MLATPELAESSSAERLQAVLPEYRRRVPLYAYPELGPLSWDNPSWRQSLSQLPVITKEQIRRDFPRNFLGPGVDLDRLADEEVVELEHTSGTSEARIPLLLPYGWWAEQERAALRLNRLVARVIGEAGEPRRATLSSPTCSGEVCYTGVPSREQRTVGDTLFLSLSKFPFLWSDADLDRMLRETLAWEPHFLDLDPVYGVRFALHCEQRGVRLPSLQFLLCSYEFLSVSHRRILERVFGVPVFNLYGSTETGHLLMEDESGTMRASVDTGYLEILDSDPRGIGDLVVTTLTNHIMPLVRYGIGDLVQRRQGAEGAAYLVHGRKMDALNLSQRVTTWDVDQCFAGLEGVAHYQLSRRPEAWLMRIVPEPGGLSTAVSQRLAGRLETLLGSRVMIATTETLLPETSGKFRLVYPKGA